MSKNDTLIKSALRELQAQWLAQAQEADAQGRGSNVDNMQQAFYQRGIAEGLRMALADIQQLLGEEAAVTDAKLNDSYTYVTREDALKLLGQTGLHITELHQHEDHTFSAILPPLQALSFEERLDKLRMVADIVILATGKLPANNKSYVDFGFRAPYSS